MPFHLPLFAPLALLILSLIWIIAMKKACKFTPPADAPWPFAASPQLALELATSPLFVTEILGARGTETGGANRASAIRFQKLDFIFILFYVLFFIAVANVSGRGQLLAPFAMGCAIATGLADMLEDLAILRLTGPKPRGSSKAFGQLKWILYFLTLALEGALLLRVTPANVRTVAGFVLGAFLISVAIGGVISSFKGTFNGIDTGAKLSSLGMIGLGDGSCLHRTYARPAAHRRAAHRAPVPLVPHRRPLAAPRSLRPQAGQPLHRHPRRARRLRHRQHDRLSRAK
jgi:hypothetical protein